VVEQTSVPVRGQRRLRLDLRAGFTEIDRGDDAPTMIERAFDRLSRHDLRRAS